ncbi:MAG: single-stranded-DNA-specific exonuclease RecJ [Desulforhopalus sp.]
MKEWAEKSAGAGSLVIPRVIEELLGKRGVAGEEAVKRFLFPRLADLPAPNDMQDLQPAANLVAECIESEKNIVVWGDYDVDGTTGTALLVNFFREIGGKVEWYIPNRLTEGYGLNLDWFVKNSARLGNDFLLVTVDCGIANHREIEQIKALGGKVIVTDHHTIKQTGGPACLVLNPSRNSCGFYGRQLAGVGVAFYLAAGVRAVLRSNKNLKTNSKDINLKQYLAFVALGTIADVVHLTSTNRTLVRAGLEALNNSDFVGLQHLLAVSELGNTRIPSEDIGFILGPKINAAGRLGNSTIVVSLLTTSNGKKARKLAKKLFELNRERQRITVENLEMALGLVSITEIESNKCIVVVGNVHLGVAGIVAAKLTEPYGVPALVLARIEHATGVPIYSGSARSVEGINIVEVLEFCSPWIEKFGGHELAAGLTVREENFTGFKKLFTARVLEATDRRVLKRKSKFDVQCKVDEIMNEKFLEFMKLLEPFGPGNETPVFEDPAAKIIDTKIVGRERQHLQLTIRGQYAQIKGIGFGLAGHIDDIQKQPVRRLLYTPTINRFRGTTSWQVRVIDI